MPKKNIRKPIVVIIRDSDEPNELHSFGIVNVYEVDFDDHDASKEAERWAWAEDHMYHALQYTYAGHQEVADLIEQAVVRNVGQKLMLEAVKAAKQRHEQEQA